MSSSAIKERGCFTVAELVAELFFSDGFACVCDQACSKHGSHCPPQQRPAVTIPSPAAPTKEGTLLGFLEMQPKAKNMGNREPQVSNSTLRIQRWKQKKKRLRCRKRIHSVSRQEFAKIRPRIGGRFVKI